MTDAATHDGHHETSNLESSDWEHSAEAWIRFVDQGDPNREKLLDPVMLKDAADVRGMQVCDVGCGEGRFCRKLSERGARVTGIDPTRYLIDRARKRHPFGQYVRSCAESMPFQSDTFDLVCSYLTLIDIQGFRDGIREMVRILKPGGKLLIANLSGHATANMHGWSRNDTGERIHYTIDHYLEEKGTHVSWQGISILNYHRPQSSYMKAFIECGLILESFDEPAYSQQQVDANPDLAFDNRIAFFVVMRWRKAEFS